MTKLKFPLHHWKWCNVFDLYSCSLYDEIVCRGRDMGGLVCGLGYASILSLLSVYGTLFLCREEFIQQ